MILTNPTKARLSPPIRESKNFLGKVWTNDARSFSFNLPYSMLTSHSSCFDKTKGNGDGFPINGSANLL